MLVVSSDDLKNAFAVATRSQLAAGSGAKKMQVYSGAMPATIATALTSQVKLLEFTIDPATWDITDNKLVVPATSFSPALATGIARWARFLNGDGDIVMMGDVTRDGGNGFVRLPSTSIVSGVSHSVSPGLLSLV